MEGVRAFVCLRGVCGGSGVADGDGATGGNGVMVGVGFVVGWGHWWGRCCPRSPSSPRPRWSAETTLACRNNAGVPTAGAPKTALQRRNYAGVPRPRCRHSGVGTQEWFRRCGPTISRPPSDWRESVQGVMGAHRRLRNGRSRELQAGAASSPRGRMPAGTWLPAVLLLSPA